MWVVVIAFIHVAFPVHAVQYAVYPLYMSEDCVVPPCNEDFSCAHTCALHGLECATEKFDCHTEAVKYCGDKELTMLIDGLCDTDLCDVSQDLFPIHSRVVVGVPFCHYMIRVLLTAHSRVVSCRVVLFTGGLRRGHLLLVPGACGRGHV